MIDKRRRANQVLSIIYSGREPMLATIHNRLSIVSAAVTVTVLVSYRPKSDITLSSCQTNRTGANVEIGGTMAHFSMKGRESPKFKL